MPSEYKSTDKSDVNTNGGAVVQGNVNQPGGDFVGRDKITTDTGDINIYYSTLPAPTSPSADEAPTPGEPPYRGMFPYDVGDADLFFGRETLIDELVDHLQQQPLLAVVGASGSGKSSLVRAGVLPALQGKKPLSDGKHPPIGSVRWAYHLITPTARPLESLAASLTRSSESVTATSTLIDDLRRDQRSLHLYARRLVSGEQRLVLLVDQFEELFTLCKDRAERQAFVENLLYAVQPDGVVTLIVTLRADFYHHCADFPALRTALETQPRYIGAMTADELRRAIEEPAHAANWSFQPGLVEQLLHDVGDEPGALPLLSHALLETWQRRRGHTLTLAGYRAAGGVQRAIAQTAEGVYKRFTSIQQTIARTIFLRLTALGEGAQDTRRRVRFAELQLTYADTDEVQQVLGELVKERLVITGDDEVQVAHEALIRTWPTLRGWLDDDREGNRIQRRLTEAANQWVEFGKEPALLYRGVLLQQAQEWLTKTRNPPNEREINPPNEREMAFLQASIDETEAEARRAADLATEREANRQRELERERALAESQRLRAEEQARAAHNLRRRNQWLRMALVLVGLVALVAAYFWGNARTQQQIAEGEVIVRSTAQSLAVTREAQANSAATAVAEQNAIAVAEKERANRNAADASNERDRANQEAENAATRAAEARIAQKDAEQQSKIAFSRQLAAHSTSELDKKNYELAILLALESGQQSDTLEAFDAIRSAIANPWHSRVALYGHLGEILQARWSKDGRKILTAGSDGSIRVWDAWGALKCANNQWASGDDTLQTLRRQPRSKAFSVNAKNSTSQTMDKRTPSRCGGQLLILEGHEGNVWQATWNQDESKILTAGDDGTVRIWDADSGKELISFGEHTTKVWQATWNQDETKILSAGEASIAQIWDVGNNQEEWRVLDGHTGSITQAIWNQDGSKLLTASEDGTARIWDAASGKELIKLGDHTEGVRQAIWNHDESKILTISEDGAGRIWDSASGEEFLVFEGGWAKWSEDGSKILTTAEDGAAHILSAEDGAELSSFDSNKNVWQAIWSQDETKILAIGEDIAVDGYSRVSVWNVSDGKELFTFQGTKGSIRKAIWNQDGSKILTSGADGVIRIWDTAEGVEWFTHLDGSLATWGQDGSKILTVGQDNSVHIWGVEDGRELSLIKGRTGKVMQAIWNSDESKILVVSEDGVVHIWDTEIDEVETRFTNQENRIVQATWSHDESKLLFMSKTIGATDGLTPTNSVSIWNLNSGQTLYMLKGYPLKINQATWSREDSKILTASWDGTARLWDATTGQELVKFTGHEGNVSQATWNYSGDKILTVSWDGTARIWDATTGQELIKLEGHTGKVTQATWNQDESKILTASADRTVRIWDANTGKELARLIGHTGEVKQATWNQDESKVLTASADRTVRVWDATTGQGSIKFEGHTDEVKQATWNQDESKILTASADRTVRVWYVHMNDLLSAACTWTPRNFTWVEWGIYMKNEYRPTCANAPIPLDVMEGIQNLAREQILRGQIISGTEQIEELNSWLQVNEQFKRYGVDVEAFVAEVSATATAALPSPTLTPTPIQPASPLRAQPTSPLPSPTVTPRATGTPVAPAPVATPGQSVTSTLSSP